MCTGSYRSNRKGDTSEKSLAFIKEEEEEDMDVQEKPLVVPPTQRQLFPGSQLPPIQLPLDYSLHTANRMATPKLRVKGGLHPQVLVELPFLFVSHILACSDVSSPVLVYLHLSWYIFTCPDISSPILVYLHLS